MSELKKRLKSNRSDNSKPSKSDDVEEKIPPEQASSNKTSLRIISRMVVIFSLLVVVYYTSNEEKLKTFAKQSEIISGKGLIVECSEEYMTEMYKYEGCFPQDCKRYVSDKVVSPTEAEQLLAVATKGIALGGSDGGASILDLHSGALSKGSVFVNLYKNKNAKDLFTPQDFNVYRIVKEKIKYSVAHHFGVQPDKIYLTHPTFFSKITAAESKTIHDQYWHPHVDKETYKSFHYTTLLYLGDYGKDFMGGRFVFIDDKINRTVEPRIGRVSMFTSGKENLHYVEKVSSGIRYAMTISFTCDLKFAIDDPKLDRFSQ